MEAMIVMGGPRRFRYLPTLAVSLISTFVGALLAITTNLASDVLTLPRWLSFVQRHPLASSLVLAVVMFGLWAVGHFYDQAGPQPATSDDVAETGERIHEQLDRIEIGQLEHDDRVLNRLPPLARQLLDEDVDHESTWQLIVAFTRDSADPYRVAREWAVAPPAAAAGLSAHGQLVVTEIMLAFGQPAAAMEFMRAALDLGMSPRAFWLFRAAQVAWTADDADAALAFLDEAQRIDPTYPLSTATRLNHEGRWTEAAAVIAGFSPETAWERDAAASVAATVFMNLDRLDDAITALEGVADKTPWAGVLLHLAQLLRHRSASGAGDSRWKDAVRARDLAIRARNLRRLWRGDSAEAIAAAAEAMFVGEDPEAVWAITRPSPEGDATPHEAADSRVLPLAALGAALTGRSAQAQQLAADANDEFVKLQVEAEVLSLQSVDGSRQAGIDAWLRVANAASTDERQLRALRFLALEGATHQAHADALRKKYPAAMAEIDSIREVASISGPDADSRLRSLEQDLSLASVRRAELIRAAGDLPRAARVLVDAMQRWKDPRLLLMAVDCYMEDGNWPGAREIAQQALTESGVLWPGRATVLRRLVDIQLALHDWSSAMSACRSLLELDDLDDDARWNLALCEFRDGSPQEALQTLRRHGEPQPTTPHRAMFLLDLVRRFCDAPEVARTALAQLRAFPQDEDMHLAAMNAISTRIDRSELPEEVGREVTEAWASFFERYPDSSKVTKYTFVDDTLPADMESMLRAHAASYQAARAIVLDDLVPVGLLGPVVGKPYAAIFPYRPLGVHRIASPLDQDVQTELQCVRGTIDQDCVVDASALFTLALIPDVAPALTRIVGRTLTTAAGLTDLLAADDFFSLPSAGTMGFDPDRDRFFAEESNPDIRQRQQQQISTMLAYARSLRRVGHPTLVNLPPLHGQQEQQEPPWLLNVDAAKTIGAGFWCDDLGLRRLAHAYGVRTFGTLSMLAAAVELGYLDEASMQQALRTLTVEYVVDLPFDQDLLISVAAEQQWQPGPVTVVLGRPAAWTQPEPAATVLRTALRRAPAEAFTAWIYQALLGLHAASPEEHRDGNLIQVSTALACEAWANPDHLYGIAHALDELVPEHAVEIIDAVLKTLWLHLSKRHSTDEAVLIMVYLVGRLSDSTRQRAMHLVLQDPSSDT
jgi:tetratricopeptide (TPR) repeat protein